MDVPIDKKLCHVYEFPQKLKKENERQNILIGQQNALNEHQNALIAQLIHIQADKPIDTEHSFVPKTIESDYFFLDFLIKWQSCQLKSVI